MDKELQLYFIHVQTLFYLSQACNAPEPLWNEPGPEKDVILERKGREEMVFGETL